MSALQGDELVTRMGKWIKKMSDRGWSPTHAANVLSSLSKYCAYLNGRESCKARLREFIEVRRSTGAKDSSVQKDFFRIRAFHRAIVDDVPNDVAEMMERFKRSPYKTETFTHDEWETIKGYIAREWLHPSIVGYHTGLRLGDVLCLRWDQIDMERLMITVKPHKTQKMGTVASVPIVQNGELHKMLLELKRYQAGEFLFPRWREEYVNKGPTNFGPSESFKNAVRKIGIKGKTFHTFRRTFITNVLSSGTSTLIAKSLVGIKSSATLEHYAAPGTDHLRDAMQRADEYRRKAAAVIVIKGNQ